MVRVISEEATLRILIERLNWPVRMVRWRTAREYAALLSSERYSRRALNIFLEWLSTRQLESEITSALAVLLCAKDDALPSYRSVAGYISKPSILADVLLRAIYGEGRAEQAWRAAHSGEAPESFTPEQYFIDHKSAHVPPFIGDELDKLEVQTGLPFMRQWAFEWHALMQATNAPYSGYPYHFVNSLLQRTGVDGQFSQRQCDVYRSAYLRVMAFAVDRWGMPLRRAVRMALNTLPVNRGLMSVDPIDRPPWLSDVPERCAVTDAPLADLARQIVTPGLSQSEMRPVALRIPLAMSVAEFASLSISAIMTSRDFVPDLEVEQNPFTRTLPWILPDGVSFDGALDQSDIAQFTLRGISGVAAPFCLDLWPLPYGFWHNDYFQIGISLPAPYAVHIPPAVKCRNRQIELVSGGICLATWRVWHDHWTPLYAKDGATRCGMVTELRQDEIAKAIDRHAMELSWFVELNIWKQQREYEEFKLDRRRAFFRD